MYGYGSAVQACVKVEGHLHIMEYCTLYVGLTWKNMAAIH